MVAVSRQPLNLDEPTDTADFVRVDTTRYTACTLTRRGSPWMRTGRTSKIVAAARLLLTPFRRE